MHRQAQRYPDTIIIIGGWTDGTADPTTTTTRKKKNRITSSSSIIVVATRQPKEFSGQFPVCGSCLLVVGLSSVLFVGIFDGNFQKKKKKSPRSSGTPRARLERIR